MSIARQYGLVDDPHADRKPTAAEKAKVAASLDPKDLAGPAPAKLAKARKALAGTKPRGTKPPAGTKPKGGRPRQIDGEPWIAAGVSRRTWFRQQAAAAKGKAGG